jgi:hypothetical protein
MTYPLDRGENLTIKHKTHMKKLFLLFTLAFAAFACQLQNEEVSVLRDASGANIEDYSVSGSSTDGYTFEFSIKFNGNAKDISHINFNFFDCDGGALTDVLAFSIDGQPYDLLDLEYGDPSSDCNNVSNSSTIKLDEEFKNKEDEDDEVKIVITLNTKSSGGYVYIKAGAVQSGGGCFGAYNFEGNCDDDEPCYEYSDETAWANGDRYVGRGNWAMYTPYAEGSVSIYAGQHHLAGTATFSAVSEDNMVTITLALAEGWSLQEGDNAVKIQGYSDTPVASNPSPGRFTTYKGNDLEVTVPAAAFYGIHLDVSGKLEVPCSNN